MPFNLGGPELVFILVIVLIVFGAGKLPDVLGQLGRGVKSFRDEAANEKTASVAAWPVARPRPRRQRRPGPARAAAARTLLTPSSARTAGPPTSGSALLPRPRAHVHLRPVRAGAGRRFDRRRPRA